MTRPATRILLASADLRPLAGEMTRLTTAAAALRAAAAAFGNGDDALARECMLTGILALQGMGGAAQGTLSAVSEEVIACARQGKAFVLTDVSG